MHSIQLPLRARLGGPREPHVLTSVRRWLLSIDPAAVSGPNRGFSLPRPSYLDEIGHAFLDGYHAALADNPSEACSALSTLDPRHRGFSIEGAAMACWLLDSLSVRAWRWRWLLSEYGSTHPYVVHVGVGWALARLPWTRRNPERLLRRFDPMLRWLVIDGYGFHEGFFRHDVWVTSPTTRPDLSDFGRRVFDQGLGRSLWFIDGADVCRIAHSISRFSRDRHPDLWSGIGLACAYAGRMDVSELDALVTAAGENRSHLALGTAFGTEARHRGSIDDEHTARACRAIVGSETSDTARLTWVSRDSAIASSLPGPKYEIWRSRTREALSELPTTCP